MRKASAVAALLVPVYVASSTNGASRYTVTCSNSGPAYLSAVSVVDVHSAVIGQKTKLQNEYDSLRHRVSVRIYIILLATLLSKMSRNSERSASVAIPGSISSNHNIHLKPCSCRGVAECGDPPVQCSSESVSVKCSNWGAIRLRPSAKRIPQNFKCLIMVR